MLDYSFLIKNVWELEYGMFLDSSVQIDIFLETEGEYFAQHSPHVGTGQETDVNDILRDAFQKNPKKSPKKWCEEIRNHRTYFTPVSVHLPNRKPSSSW